MTAVPRSTIGGEGSASRSAATPSRFGDEGGITLVELLVSIIILGILFSAVAAALINFSTASLNNERRVQATGFMSSVHEQLQTIAWDLAVLYEDEVATLPAAAQDLGYDATLGEFEEEPLVTVPGPGGDPRVDLIPEPFVDAGNIRTYTFVTWSADVGDGATAKRFTTIVEWDVLGRTGSQRFQSLRAPSLADIEASAPPEVELFDVSPSSVALDSGSGLTTQAASIVAHFSRGISSAEVTYVQDGTGLEVSVSLSEVPSSITPGGEFTRWTGSLPTGSGPFVDDAALDQPLHLLGVALSGEEATQSRDMRFSSTFSGVPPVVHSAQASPTTVYVRDIGGVTRFCSDLVVQAVVSGLDASDGFVTATFVGPGGTGAGLSPEGVISGSNDVFSLVFDQDAQSPWRPKGPGAGNQILVSFNVRAENPGGVSSQIVTTNDVSVRRQGGGGC